MPLWLDRRNVCTNYLVFISNRLHSLSNGGALSTSAEGYMSATSIANIPRDGISISKISVTGRWDLFLSQDLKSSEA